jgi:hypothetical protein
MIVGGYAVAFHGHARYTKDIDIFYRASQPNITNLRRALVEFGFEHDQVPETAFSKPGNIVVFGAEPLRVDLLNQIDGVEFDAAYGGSILGRYGATQARFIGRNDLLHNKRATQRTRDKADAEELE